jgi:hypothetical protein
VEFYVLMCCLSPWAKFLCHQKWAGNKESNMFLL